MDSLRPQDLLGRNVDRFRKLRSFTVEDLAARTEVSVGHLNDVIHGRKWVSADLLGRLSLVLGVSVQALFGAPDAAPGVELLFAEYGKDLEQRLVSLVRDASDDYRAKLAGRSKESQ